MFLAQSFSLSFTMKLSPFISPYSQNFLLWAWRRQKWRSYSPILRANIVFYEQSKLHLTFNRSALFSNMSFNATSYQFFQMASLRASSKSQLFNFSFFSKRISSLLGSTLLLAFLSSSIFWQMFPTRDFILTAFSLSKFCKMISTSSYLLAIVFRISENTMQSFFIFQYQLLQKFFSLIRSAMNSLVLRSPISFLQACNFSYIEIYDISSYLLSLQMTEVKDSSLSCRYFLRSTNLFQNSITLS